MEDYLIYFALAGLLGIVTIALSFFLNKPKGAATVPAAPENVNQNNPRGRRPGNRRDVFNRRIALQERNRNGEPDAGGDDDGAAADQIDSDEELKAQLNDPKLGAKRRAKLEAKADKKHQREAEERSREEKKLRELKQEEERKKLEEQEEEKEKLKKEEEQRAREEQARREEEEYNAMKAAFTVEDEGCDVADAEEEENLLEKFVNHIKARKVILFEELATQFGLKVPEAIDRLNALVENGRLTGVMDDRGKFIYISEEELTKFAKFIKQRGRVSMSDLVENSTSIINIVPDQPVTVQ